jgi:flagellar hook protein FlgE
MRTLLTTATLAGALLISLQPVQAGPFLAKLGDTVKVTSDQVSSNQTATISFSGLPGNPGSLAVYSGPELLSGTFGTANTGFQNLAFYCTDLYNYSSGSATYTVGYLTSSHQPSGINDLTTLQINDIATLISLNHSDQSATQLAIWKVEYGTAFSFTNTSAATASDVTAYLASLDGSPPANVQLYQIKDTGVQGFAYVAAVPEPGTLAVLGVGLLGLALVTRRRVA